MKTLCKTVAHTLGVCLVLAAAPGTLAQDTAASADPHEPLKQFIQKKSCTACHYVDKRKYGPNFLEVAHKYANADQATLDTLVTKMRAGGAGVWGEDPMPPQPQLSLEEAQQMLQMILALQPKAP